jgi:hypothetical protein
MSLSFSLNFKAALGAIAPYVVSRRMKKLILFSSLTAVLKQDDVLDKQTLEKLNLVMGLSNDVEAMNFPVYMRSAIWKGGAPIQVPDAVFSKYPSEQDLQTVLSELISKIPHWLRYGKDAEMQSDATRYLLHGREYLDRRKQAKAC